ncbi:MAG: GAF domain-containing protein [Deltaproteobacteria bacterium]|nr:GAF domain-containing protein [Deltaproteobacteria bacterium]
MIVMDWMTEMSGHKSKMVKDKKCISIPFSRKKLRERNRSLSILRNMSDSLSLSLGTRELLNHALARVLEDFDLDAGRIYLMEEDERHLFLAAHSGIETSGLERMDLDEGFSGKAARTKSFIAQYVTELEDQNRVELLKSKGFNIVICVPLITMGKVTGVMNLAIGRPFELDPNEIDLLYVVGSQVAAAIENARLYNDLQKKLKQLAERKEMIKLFAYSIAHDLKSPTIGIHGFSRRLKEKCGEHLDEKGKRYCDEIIKLAEHVVILLEEMNSYIATKEVQPHFKVVRLKEITATIKSEFAARLKARCIEFSAPDSDPQIIADKVSLLRAFRNLVDNAIKYGGDNMHRISINYSQDEAVHILSVSDDGTGIVPEDREKVFDAFRRNNTSQGTMGSGLGLAIVKEVAKKHGGRVWVETGVVQGIRFNISIAKNLSVTA